MEGQYSGVDILEALESAHNYNDYLTRLIRESTDLIDFGGGIGTFSKRLRTAGYHVKCIEPDPLQRQRLEEQGFDTLENIAAELSGFCGRCVPPDFQSFDPTTDQSLVEKARMLSLEPFALLIRSRSGSKHSPA
jgi:hypothetical protein